MAGIYERVHGDGIDGQGGGRFNIAILKDIGSGLGLGLLSRAEADQALIDATEFSIEGAVATDVKNMFDNFEQGAAQAKLVYTQQVLSAVNMAEVRVPLMTEAKFRAALNIP